MSDRIIVIITGVGIVSVCDGGGGGGRGAIISYYLSPSTPLLRPPSLASPSSLLRWLLFYFSPVYDKTPEYAVASPLSFSRSSKRHHVGPLLPAVVLALLREPAAAAAAAAAAAKPRQPREPPPEPPEPPKPLPAVLVWPAQRRRVARVQLLEFAAAAAAAAAKTPHCRPLLVAGRLRPPGPDRPPQLLPVAAAAAATIAAAAAAGSGSVPGRLPPAAGGPS